ncbi:hypothetical protein [Marinilabilia salmonicolor]|uniref:hypothetical protein n=1 Tax=Marinilabilia salmonicolor TaxID=989 RepID=UPI00029A4702|nr:hypothetical protein [Marinilabilia salmonicolor]
MKFSLFILTFLLVTTSLKGQESKEVVALPIDKPLTIDAVLDEAFYQQVTPATDFLQQAAKKKEYFLLKEQK